MKYLAKKTKRTTSFVLCVEWMNEMFLLFCIKDGWSITERSLVFWTWTTKTENYINFGDLFSLLSHTSQKTNFVHFQPPARATATNNHYNPYIFPWFSRRCYGTGTSFALNFAVLLICSSTKIILNSVKWDNKWFLTSAE